MNLYRIRRAIRRALDFITGAATRRELNRLERGIQKTLDENWGFYTRLNALEHDLAALKKKRTPVKRRKK